MKNCKDFVVFKFYYATPMETDRQIKKNWKRAQEFVKFKKDLIDLFAGETHSQISENYTHYSKKNIGQPLKKWAYKGWMYDSYEIGIDMLKDNQGMQFEHQWKYLYIGVPKTNKKVLNFFEKNKPEWVTIVSKIQYKH